MDKYHLGNISKLKSYCTLYFPLVIDYSESVLGINLKDKDFIGDHLGIQTSSSEEYSYYFNLLSQYMSHTFTNTLHDRRVSIFNFKEKIFTKDLSLNGIEIFEQNLIQIYQNLNWV